MYRDLRDRNTVFSGLIAASPATLGVEWNNHAESVPAEMVSGNYFATLGVRPAVGRLFGIATKQRRGRIRSRCSVLTTGSRTWRKRRWSAKRS